MNILERLKKERRVALVVFLAMSALALMSHFLAAHRDKPPRAAAITQVSGVSDR